MEPADSTSPSAPTPILSSKVYDKLKWVALVFLPALGTFWFSVATSFDIPLAKEILGVIVALDTFLGVLLGLSTRVYNNSDAKFDGNVVRTGNAEQPYSLEFNAPLHELAQQGQITLKVVGGP